MERNPRSKIEHQPWRSWLMGLSLFVLALAGCGQARDPFPGARERALRGKALDDRLAAIQELGEAEDRRAIPALLDLLRDADPSIQVSAADALYALGDDRGYPNLLVILRERGSRGGAGMAAWSLGHRHERRGIPALIEALGAEDRDLRRVAATSLGQIGDPVAVESLGYALDRDPANPHAAEALGVLADRRAVPALSRAFERAESSVGTRLAAAWALAALGEDGYVEYLVAHVRAVVEAPPMSVTLPTPDGEGQMLATNPRYRQWRREHPIGDWRAILYLARTRDPRAFAPLVAALQAEDRNTIRTAVEALAYLGDPRAVPALVKALGERDRSRVEAITFARALVLFEDEAAQAAVDQAVPDAAQRQCLRQRARAHGYAGAFLTLRIPVTLPPRPKADPDC